MIHRHVAIATMLLVPLVAAGCASPGGTSTLTGKNAPGAAIELTNVNVVDGTLRDIMVRNHGTKDIPAGAWSFHFNGTTSGRPNTHDAAVQGPLLAKGANATLSFANDKQPDWQDGTDLTLTATAPDGATGSVTVRTV